jgi:hypothetical protein
VTFITFACDLVHCEGPGLMTIIGVGRHSSTVANRLALNFAAYGQGAAGYAKRFGPGMADESTSGFFRTFVFPSVLHQVPGISAEAQGPGKLVLRTHSSGP